MKLTKLTIKNLIREELQNIMQEQQRRPSDRPAIAQAVGGALAPTGVAAAKGAVATRALTARSEDEGLTPDEREPTKQECLSGIAPKWQCDAMGYRHAEEKEEKKIVRRRPHRLTRRGEAILKKHGFGGFDDFYAQLKEHGLMEILGPSGPDKKWGKAHALAMEELKNTEKAKDEEVFKKQEDEEKGKAHSVKLAGRDAIALYKELKGLGSGDAEEVLARAKDGPGLAALYDAYAHVLVKRKDTDDGDLVKWLVDDGLEEWAMRVRMAVKTRKERAAEETPISGELDADDLAYKAELEAEAEQEKEDSGELEENATYSSFSEHQKLFENWNRYVKSTNED